MLPEPDLFVARVACYRSCVAAAAAGDVCCKNREIRPEWVAVLCPSAGQLLSFLSCLPSSEEPPRAPPLTPPVHPFPVVVSACQLLDVRYQGTVRGPAGLSRRDGDIQGHLDLGRSRRGSRLSAGFRG